MDRFYGSFENCDDIENEFGIELPPGMEIIYAEYNSGDYEGYAFVLYRQDGKMFEVNGYHCSCYGLEGQWEPEETFIEALRMKSKYMESAEFKKCIDGLEATDGNRPA